MKKPIEAICEGALFVICVTSTKNTPTEMWIGMETELFLGWKEETNSPICVKSFGFIEL